MASFSLQPAKIRGAYFVDDRRKEPLTLSWRELVAKLAPKEETNSEVKLRALKIDSYIGLIKSAKTGKLVSFLLINPDRSGNLGAILKRDPSFETRIVEAYRVTNLAWDASVSEVQHTKPV